jgi:hypothetical protein
MEIFERSTFLPRPYINREKCVVECMGCKKMYSEIPLGECVLEDHVCIAYINPKAIQKRGCALQSNKAKLEEVKKKVNPLKASKRARRK